MCAIICICLHQQRQSEVFSEWVRRSYNKSLGRVQAQRQCGSSNDGSASACGGNSKGVKQNTECSGYDIVFAVVGFIFILLYFIFLRCPLPRKYLLAKRLIAVAGKACQSHRSTQSKCWCNEKATEKFAATPNSSTTAAQLTSELHATLGGRWRCCRHIACRYFTKRLNNYLVKLNITFLWQKDG